MYLYCCIVWAVKMLPITVRMILSLHRLYSLSVMEKINMIQQKNKQNSTTLFQTFSRLFRYIIFVIHLDHQHSNYWKEDLYLQKHVFYDIREFLKYIASLNNNHGNISQKRMTNTLICFNSYIIIISHFNVISKSSTKISPTVSHWG